MTDDDIVYDASKIDDVVEEGCVEKLRATHLLEHFGHRETQDILSRWYKIMAPGGQIYIEVPNLNWFVNLWENQRYEEVVRYMFGGQEDEGDFHKTAFNPHLIEQHLKAVGFKDIQVNENTMLMVTAIK